MSLQVHVRAEAEADLTQAFDWYERQRTGLGHEFLDQVRQAFRQIAASPTHHPFAHLHVRRALLRRFPYKVFYFVEAGSVTVIGVVHAKRDPAVWQSRVT